MKSCPPESDLRQLGDAIIAEFERRVALIPNDLCAPFHEEARQLETELLTIYRLVALCARKEEELAEISKAWGFMVQMCDAAAQQLNRLVNQHPSCGADAYYDRVLDLRNKCQRLQQMHS